MKKKKSGDNRHGSEEQLENCSDSKYDIATIAAAAFDGDLGALALLDELSEEGDLDAIGFAELGQGNIDYEEDDRNTDEGEDYWAEFS